MKIQLTSNLGCAKGMETITWFNTLGDAQDYCELIVKKYFPVYSHAKMINELQDCNVKGLTKLMTNVNKFKFEWIN